MLLGALPTWWMMDTADGAENQGKLIRGYRKTTEPWNTFKLKSNHSCETLGWTHQPGWWWCWRRCNVVSKDFGRTPHWQLVFQRCTVCEPGGRLCGRWCRWVPADEGQTARCPHSGCSRHAHCRSFYIWCCRQRLLGLHLPVGGSTPASERSHSQWKWHFVELMEQL